MTRIRRYHERHRPYFVTAVVRDRRPIFRDHQAATLLRDVLNHCRQRYGFLILSYVIMPDHFHGVIVPNHRNTISDVMRYIKGRFARMYNATYHGAGTVWQPKFYDIAIRNEHELMQRISYVEMNPVEAGIVSQPEDYPFSSRHPNWRSDLPVYLEG